MAPPVSVAGAFITACMVPESFAEGFRDSGLNILISKAMILEIQFLKGTV